MTGKTETDLKPCPPGYCLDESRLSGQAEFIAFPENPEEAAGVIRRAAEEGFPLTIQGARTGITGGAVPRGGLVLSTERMNRPLEFFRDSQGAPVLRVQPGMSFEALGNHLSRGLPVPERGLYFPPNPTESTATLGGGFGCNAQGPNSLRWGGLGAHLQDLTWITPAGEIWTLPRGRYRFDETGCPLPGGSRLSCDSLLPAGGSRFLHPRPGLDLLDFLAGSEGLAGFAGELSLTLRGLPAAAWGVVYFFEEDSGALNFAESLGQWRGETSGGEALTTLEYYDHSSLDLVRSGASRTAALRSLPPLDSPWKAAIQVELEGEDSPLLEDMLTGHLELFRAAGGREEDTWAAGSLQELEKFRLLRHGVPELINTELDRLRRELPELRKTAGDFEIPPPLARTYRETYRRDMEEEGLRGFVFGHLGEGRLHVNLLPRNGEEIRRSRTLLDRWAALTVGDGGLIAAENGIGRLKGGLLRRYGSPERWNQIESFLRVLDPGNRLGGVEILNPPENGEGRT
ncbi:MAG: FAD-binding oxidoreductase [Spirochaetales bacterium]|jgi:D-lactate dehydrogenase (cytochrome)|nr:FAD-binding oxidoreductase [Spirochaetales bacterium]